MIQAKDHIGPSKNHINRPQNTDNIKPKPIYVARESTKATIAENLHHEFINQQQLNAKDEQIQRLQHQIDAIQNSNTRRPRQSFVFREKANGEPCVDEQSDQISLQLLQSQNQTIQRLKSQLRSLQLQPQDRTSAKSKKYDQAIYTADKSVDKHTSHDANHKSQATSKLAKNRVSHKVLQTSLNKDATATAILNQITEFNNKKLINLNLSGLSNSSAKAKVNKEITHKRFNYLSEKIVPWISKENVFFQNFWDALSAVEVVSDAQN